MMENDNGHDWESPRLDALADFYITFATIYTAALLLGLYILYPLRRTTAVRLRSFWKICSTVFTLHIYLVLIFIAYPLNGLYKCGAEFWIMSVVLPLGMALFQGENLMAQVQRMKFPNEYSLEYTFASILRGATSAR